MVSMSVTEMPTWPSELTLLDTRGLLRANGDAFANVLSVQVRSGALVWRKVVQQLQEFLVRGRVEIDRLTEGLRIVDTRRPVDLDPIVFRIAEVRAERNA